MFEVKVITDFSAAHFLKHYKGKCESLHGHNWKVEAVIQSPSLDQLGMVMDFKNLKKLLNEVIEQFDHKLLNELGFFKNKNTTSEIIAKCIFNELKKKISQYCKKQKPERLCLKQVAVWEQESSCAVYSETQRQ